MAIKDGFLFRKGCLLKEFNTTLIALLLKSLGANRLPEASHDEGAFKPRLGLDRIVHCKFKSFLS